MSEFIFESSIIKKIFIDTYNRSLAFDLFKQNKLDNDDWIFPPACMQDNSYDYAVFWYQWQVEGDWFIKDLAEAAAEDAYESVNSAT